MHKVSPEIISEVAAVQLSKILSFFERRFPHGFRPPLQPSHISLEYYCLLILLSRSASPFAMLNQISRCTNAPFPTYVHMRPRDYLLSRYEETDTSECKSTNLPLRADNVTVQQLCFCAWVDAMTKCISSWDPNRARSQAVLCCNLAYCASCSLKQAMKFMIIMRMTFPSRTRALLNLLLEVRVYVNYVTATAICRIESCS